MPNRGWNPILTEQVNTSKGTGEKKLGCRQLLSSDGGNGEWIYIISTFLQIPELPKWAYTTFTMERMLM